MTKTYISNNGVMWPTWPANIQIAGGITVNNITMAPSASAALYCVGTVQWSDGGAHDINAISFRGTAGSTPVFTLRISLQDIDLVNGPPARSDGTVDQSATVVNPSTGLPTYTVTLNQARSSVANGTQLALVFDYSAYTSGNMSIAGLSPVGGVPFLTPGIVTFDGVSTYSNSTNIPTFTFISNDGTIGYFAGSLPVVPTTNTVTYNSSSAINEYATEYTISHNMWCNGVRMLIRPSASADFNIVLYQSNSIVASSSLITNVFISESTPRPIEVAWPDVLLLSGSKYQLAIKPTTANGISIYTVDFSSSAQLQAWAGPLAYVSRSVGSNWSPSTGTRQIYSSLKINAFEPTNFDVLSGSYVISGSVTNAGTPVSGATVRLTRQSDNLTISTSSGTDGKYRFNVVSGSVYHAVVEYQSGSQRYNAFSKWDLTPRT